MLIDSVIIVLREVLEAALLIAVLLAAARRLALRRPRFGLASGLGILGAALFAVSLHQISNWFDGVGYEVANGAIHGLVYLCILSIIALLRAAGRDNRALRNALPWIMVVAVSLAITREGSEILLYFSSFLHQVGVGADALIGAALGLGVGFSAGALFYYLLISLQPRHVLPVTATALTLAAAGMGAQAVILLIQADWLPAQAPLWDTSPWLPEQSLPGQILYALLGYEATPSPLQVACYLTSIATAAVGYRLGARYLARPADPERA